MRPGRPRTTVGTHSGDFNAERLYRALGALPAAPVYWVAYSGGADSHVLLHALAALRPRLGAAVRAVHVDHGLHPDARAWSEHCAAVCAALDVMLRVLRVDAHAARGESPEAAARQARYAALASVVGPGEILFTAHHRDDQAETVLLQLLRGAGPAGLCGMASQRCLGAGLLTRPLLGFSRAALRRYAAMHGLSWVEDSANLDSSVDRNFLRHEVLPVLRRRWPGLAKTLPRAAAVQAQALEVLEACARRDLEVLQGPDLWTLRLDRLRALDAARQHNALRAWLRRLGLPVPSAAQLECCRREVAAARNDREPCVRWPGAEVRRYRDLLHAMSPLPPAPGGVSLPWDPAVPLALPNGLGVLRAAPAARGGLRLAGARAVQVRFRRGGERCRPAARARTRDLKKLLQEHGVPPWLRPLVPLVYVDTELAAVADLWVCASFQAAEGEAAVRIRWEGAPAGVGAAH